jgi:DNA-directed RNA polymerase subunit L
MKINIVKREKGYIEFDFAGEGHTLLSLLQSSLLEDNNVEMAGFSRPHPLMDRSKLFIKLKKGDDVLGAVKKAAGNADRKLDNFLSQFEKSLSKQ